MSLQENRSDPSGAGTDVSRWSRPVVVLALVVVLLPLLGALVGLGVALVTPPKYTASAYVFISGTGADSAVSPSEIAQATARVATSESVLISGGADEVLLRAAAEDELTASSSPDAPLVDLAATAGTAQQAADLANQLSVAVGNSLSSITDQLTMESRVFAAASPPAEPSSPNVLVNVVAGAALGALAAAIVVTLRRPRAEVGR